MPRALALFAALVLGAPALVAQSQPQTVILGRIVAADSGDPLVHARIVVFNDATPLPAIFSDASGRFASAPLPPGRYRLTATKAGYAATSVARLDNLPAAGADVRMPRSAAISGRVIDRFGEPAAGVQVRLLERAADRAGPGPQVRASVTDDLGEYRFGGLAQGSYYVGMRSDPFIPAIEAGDSTVFYPGVRAFADAQAIVIQPGDERVGVDFVDHSTQPNTVEFRADGQVVRAAGVFIVGPNGQRVTPTMVVGTGAIRGRVVREDGVGLAHATVSTSVPQFIPGQPRTQATLSGMRSVQTDEDGRYELTELPPGQYRLVASKLGYTSFAYGQREGAERGEPIEMAESQTRTRVDFTLPKFSAVMGHVVDEFGDPVENAVVTLSQIRFQGGQRRVVSVSGMSGRTTDDLGRYRIYAVPPGDYVVLASVGQVLLAQSSGVSGYGATYFPGTLNPGEAQKIRVPPSQDVTAVDLSLVPIPTAAISGRKVGSDGQPFGGSLNLFQSQRSGGIITPAVGARIYEDGRFEFPNVPPGEYVIHASQGNSGPGREGEFAMAFVTMTGDDVRDVLLQSTPGSTISGRVIFEGDGTRPNRGFSVTTSRADLDRSPAGTGAQADVAGDLSFVLTGIRGPRRIAVGPLPAGWMLKSVFAKGVDVTDVALPFGMPDESLTDVQVVVTNRITQLTGSVTDARGNLAGEYALLVFPVDRDRWYPGSRYFRRSGPGSSGTFSVAGLPPADYAVAAVASGWSVLKEGGDAWQDPEVLDSIAQSSARITLTEGQSLAISARLVTR